MRQRSSQTVSAGEGWRLESESALEWLFRLLENADVLKEHAGLFLPITGIAMDFFEAGAFQKIRHSGFVYADRVFRHVHPFGAHECFGVIGFGVENKFVLFAHVVPSHFPWGSSREALLIILVQREERDHCFAARFEHTVDFFEVEIELSNFCRVRLANLVFQY